MRGYIACGMTGIPLSNWPHFEEWEHKLQAVGWDIVSPTRVDEAVGSVKVVRDNNNHVLSVEPTEKFEYENILAVDFLALTFCDAIIMLPGWTSSSGAKRELAHAKSLGLQVFAAEDALDVRL